MIEQSLLVPVAEASQVGEARRAALELARRTGLPPTKAEKVAIISTEMASNLVKHTHGGHLVLRSLQQGEQTGVELLALDQGPGMRNVADCLRDGYSTAGSRGEGLGAIQRLAATFDLHSQPELGTALLAQVWAAPPLAVSPPPRLESGAINLPKPGQEVCGDSWRTCWQVDQGLVLVADGLGHGTAAATAAREAVRLFVTPPAHGPAPQTPRAFFDRIHAGLRSTRGAALAIVAIEYGYQVQFVGVGNIAGAVWVNQRLHHLVSHNGIVGHEARRVQEFTYPWAKGALLILHSDGLQSRWNLEHYPGLINRHPSLIAGVLWRDFRRGPDDVTVVVVREHS